MFRLPRFLAAWLGLNPDLPFIEMVPNPKHGDVAKNSRHQKVVYDEKQGGRWVMPQQFSDRTPVTIK
jgi:hypothetical protein